MTGAPNYRLPRQKRDRASFVRALRAERMQLITRLQNQDPLSAYRHNYKLVLLKLGRFIACEMCWTGRPGLRQRFKVTNDRISNTDQPAEEARAQKKLSRKMARRDVGRSRLGRSFIAHFMCLVPLQCKHLFGSETLRPAFVMTNIYECLRRFCDYRAQRTTRSDREQDHHRRTPREQWSFDFGRR